MKITVANPKVEIITERKKMHQEQSLRAGRVTFSLF